MKKYSYIENPFSQEGFFSLGFGIISLIVTIIVAVSSVNFYIDNTVTDAVVEMAAESSQEVDLFLAAAGLFAIVLSFMSIWCFYLSTKFKNINQNPANIGGCISIVVILFWLSIW